MQNLKRLIITLIIISMLSGCNIKTKEPISKTGFYFDTVIEITLYSTTDYQLIDDCFSFCKEFEQTVSRTISSSDIYKLNHAKGKFVTVSDTTLELMKLGVKYGNLTNGAFDITIAPLSELWDFKNNNGIIPSDNEIQEALSHVNYKNIIFEGNKVRLSDPKAAVDLGGIAKGYMADELKEYLTSKNVDSALINLGGNIVTIGNKPNGKPFHLGIQKPFEKHGVAITSIDASDSSIISSGVYERYFKIDDTIYHHILDTKTGYPCQNNLLGVTILCSSSVDGDALSTACFTLGVNDAMELLKQFENTEAIFITDEYKMIDTRKGDLK